MLPPTARQSVEDLLQKGEIHLPLFDSYAPKLTDQLPIKWPIFPCRQTVKVQVLEGTAVLVHTMKAR
jgi:hypothetical protein